MSLVLAYLGYGAAPSRMRPIKTECLWAREARE